MAPRPTEIKAVVALLEDEHPDVEILARLVIQTVDDLRAGRSFYTVVTQYKYNLDEFDGYGYVTWANGIFPTANKARQAVEKGEVHTMTEAQSMIVEIRPLGPTLPGEESEDG